MSERMALKAAIDLWHVPSQVRLLRSEPLPDGVLTLLRIAAGEAEALQGAATLTDRSGEELQQAATFFIEQILFAPDADSYRVLGETTKASAGELRRNVALLLRWLHPDLDRKGERALFVGKVTAAWNDLKTPERRAAYDEARNNKKASRPSANHGQKSFRRRGRSAGVAPYQRRAARPPHAKNGGGLLYRALCVLFRVPLP